MTDEERYERSLQHNITPDDVLEMFFTQKWVTVEMIELQDPEGQGRPPVNILEINAPSIKLSIRISENGLGIARVFNPAWEDWFTVDLEIETTTEIIANLDAGNKLPHPNMN